MSEDTLKKSANTTKRLQQAFRASLADDATSLLIDTFLTAALNEGKSVAELAELVGASKSTVSRQLLDLSGRLRNDKDGYGVLMRVAHPHNLRSITYALTPKGKLLLRTLDETLKS